MSEKDEQSAIIQIARATGGLVWVLGTRRARGDYQGTRQTPGLPDLWIVWPNLARGHAAWWEVKTATGRRSPAQVAFAEACAAAGVAYGCGDSRAFEAWCADRGLLHKERVMAAPSEPGPTPAPPEAADEAPA